MAPPGNTPAGAFDAESSLPVPSADIVALLRRTKEWKFYRQHFQARTGMRLDLTPFPLSDEGSQKQEGDTGRGNAFCRLMNPGRTPLCAYCPLSVLKSKKCKGATSPESAHCGAGLLEMTVPVRFQNRPAVRLWTGQVTMSQLVVATFPLRASSVWSVCPPEKLHEAAESWCQTPVVLPETIARYRIHMEAISEQLSMLTERILGVGAHDGSPSQNGRAGLVGNRSADPPARLQHPAPRTRHLGAGGPCRDHPSVQKDRQ